MPKHETNREKKQKQANAIMARGMEICHAVQTNDKQAIANMTERERLDAIKSVQRCKEFMINANKHDPEYWDVFVHGFSSLLIETAEKDPVDPQADAGEHAALSNLANAIRSNLESHHARRVEHMVRRVAAAAVQAVVKQYRKRDTDRELAARRCAAAAVEGVRCAAPAAARSSR